MDIKVDKELFQWEKDRRIFVTTENEEPEIFLVQFYNKTNCCSPYIPLVGGTALIPNYLLRESLPIMVLACSGNKDNAQVIFRKEFRVLKRARPENYYDDEEGTKTEIIYDGGEEK